MSATGSPSDSYSVESPTASPLSATAPKSLAAKSSRRSSIRPLVPDDKPRALAIPLATASPTQATSGPSPCGGGPASRNYGVPSRPKPGRKPATDEPQTKRKAQNRESQRAFRARKAAKVQELATQVESGKQQHQDEVNALLMRIDNLEQRLKHTEEAYHATSKRCDYWKEQFESLRDNGATSGTTMIEPPSAQLGSYPAMMMTPDASNESPGPTDYRTPDASTSFLCGRCRPDHCECIEETLAAHAQDPPFMEAVALPRRRGVTPMQDVQMQVTKVEDPSELEIDFTSAFAKPAPAIDFMGDGEHQTCGFCTRPDNCFCRDESIRNGADGGASLSQVTSGESAKSANASAPVKGMPGSCDACQQNPEQKAWCQRVAQLRGEATPPLSRRNSARSNSLDIMEPKINSTIDRFSQKSSAIPGIRSVGCTETYKLFDGRVPMDVDHPEWRQLRPIQPTSSGPRRDTIMSMEPGTYSAMEVDVGSILTTLQHSRAPLEPRPSDGPHATIVKKAEELRRSTLSPAASAQSQTDLAPVSAFNMDTTP
ncbi:hypothetical protein BKA63DRAFT_517985 [Paraphoma chrysanthemicola]|nr:hypothetical protein BKA63DRAFT_517985 [Paraphoma chrysanthemicola]